MNYEPKDASLRVIGISAALLAFWIVGSLVAAATVYRARNEPDGGAGIRRRQTSFTAGYSERLGILEDRAAVQADAARRLRDYGWIDQPKGAARVPIERAMAMLAEQGLPPEPANATPATISGGARTATKEGGR